MCGKHLTDQANSPVSFIVCWDRVSCNPLGDVLRGPGIFPGLQSKPQDLVSMSCTLRYRFLSQTNNFYPFFYHPFQVLKLIANAEKSLVISLLTQDSSLAVIQRKIDSEMNVVWLITFLKNKLWIWFPAWAGLISGQRGLREAPAEGVVWWSA